jgi:hypothetical protein
MSRQALVLDAKMLVRAVLGRRGLELLNQHSFALQSPHSVTLCTDGW